MHQIAPYFKCTGEDIHNIPTQQCAVAAGRKIKGLPKRALAERLTPCNRASDPDAPMEETQVSSSQRAILHGVLPYDEPVPTGKPPASPQPMDVDDEAEYQSRKRRHRFECNSDDDDISFGDNSPY